MKNKIKSKKTLINQITLLRVKELNLSYCIPNFNPNLNPSSKNLSSFQQEYNHNQSLRKGSFNNNNQISYNSSYSQIKNPKLPNNNNNNDNPNNNNRHKNSFNCEDNRGNLGFEFVLNNMNSTSNLNSNIINNNNNNISSNNNISNSNNSNNNNNINININNNTNYFNFNIDQRSSNQFFSEYEKVPRKRSHNIPGNFSTSSILDQIANSSGGNSMLPGALNLHLNNFINSNSLYGKILENMGSMGSIPNIGEFAAGRFDIPGFNQFSGFSPYNFPSTNAAPVINFNFNNNITTANAAAAAFGSKGLGFLSNSSSSISSNQNSNASFSSGLNNFSNAATANLCINNNNNNRENSSNNSSNYNSSFNGNTNNIYNNKLNLFNQDYIPYTCKLHNDILDYLNDVSKIVEILKPIKLNVVANIEKMLKQFLDYEITIDVFGSFASDLSIESSDIDLKVNILNENSDAIDYDRIIFSLVKFFNEKNVFENVTPIHTASIPIIKLVL